MFLQTGKVGCEKTKQHILFFGAGYELSRSIFDPRYFELVFLNTVLLKCMRGFRMVNQERLYFQSPRVSHKGGELGGLSYKLMAWRGLLFFFKRSLFRRN